MLTLADGVDSRLNKQSSLSLLLHKLRKLELLLDQDSLVLLLSRGFLRVIVKMTVVVGDFLMLIDSLGLLHRRLFD